MKNTYRSADEAVMDKGQLTELLDALNASPSALRHDECGLWILHGARGYCSTWGDGKTWMLVLTAEVSARQWGFYRKRLVPFCELTQDGETDGVLRLHHLPTLEEADDVRDVLGIRKRIELSVEELARRQEHGRWLAAH